MKNRKKIEKPNEIANDENKYIEFNIDDLRNHYEKYFEEKNNIFVKSIFSLVLLTDKNIVLILAGSLAGVPLNILTNFYSATFVSIGDWIFHILQLAISFGFYIFYLIFVYYYLYIHSSGDEYINYALSSKHYSRKNINKAINNIKYSLCIKKFIPLCIFSLGTFIFSIILIVLLLLP